MLKTSLIVYTGSFSITLGLILQSGAGHVELCNADKVELRISAFIVFSVAESLEQVYL